MFKRKIFLYPLLAFSTFLFIPFSYGFTVTWPDSNGNMRSKTVDVSTNENDPITKEIDISADEVITSCPNWSLPPNTTMAIGMGASVNASENGRIFVSISGNTWYFNPSSLNLSTVYPTVIGAQPSACSDIKIVITNAADYLYDPTNSCQKATSPQKAICKQGCKECRE
ncbi:MAG: hypothetical protein JSR33_02320 [Proteobacteria bacterium]|nr:hypothetical protein [Pseudomonadota bacterium]